MFTPFIECDQPIKVQYNDNNCVVLMDFGKDNWDIVMDGSREEVEDWVSRHKELHKPIEISQSVKEKDAIASSNLPRLFERECKYCGAPMGVYQIDVDTWNVSDNQSRYNIAHHNDNEHTFDSNRIYLVKTEFICCATCRIGHEC